MEFALSEDQRLLQGSVMGTLAGVSGLDAVREMATGAPEQAHVLRDAMAELGTRELLVPEAYGGLGLGALEAALVQEALGAHVSPADFMARSALSVVSVLAAGSDAQKESILPRLASGEMQIAIALTEQVSRREGAGIETSDGKLSGKALFALEAEGATHIIVADIAGKLWLAPMSANIEMRKLTTIDHTRQFDELAFQSVDATPLAETDHSKAAVNRGVALGRILLAADTLGAAQVMLDKAVAYAKERKQFGRVIGSFQAVKHMCAEMAAKLEPARALVWHAAYLFDMEPEKAAVMACLAKSHISEVGTFIARTATEVHGGMGFTDLVGLHYWFKRIGVNRQLLGGPELLREEAASLQGWT